MKEATRCATALDDASGLAGPQGQRRLAAGDVGVRGLWADADVLELEVVTVAQLCE